MDCKSKETRIKLRERKETGLKFIAKVEKVHLDRMTFQVQEMSLIYKGKRDSDGVCESATRQGMIVNCKVQRELSVEGCKSKGNRESHNSGSTKFKANSP